MDIKNTYKEIFPDHLRITNKEMRKRLRQNYYIIHRLDDIQHIQGFALIHRRRNIYHLDYLGVHSTAQGKGIGKQLISLILEKYKKITLECEDNLIPYYTKFGFVDSKYDYRWNNLALHYMTRGMNYIEILKQYIALTKEQKDYICTIGTNDSYTPYSIIHTVTFWFDKHHTWVS